MKKLFLLLCLVLICGVIFTACGGKDTTADDSTETPVGTTAPDSGDGPTVTTKPQNTEQNPGADASPEHGVASPDGKTVITLDLTSADRVTYTVKQDGETVLEESTLGIKTSLGDFTKGLAFLSEEIATVNETYEVLSGKADKYVNHCNEKTLHFKKDDVKFDIVLRAYDDGIAFRYIITAEDNTRMTVAPGGEVTSFNLPNTAKIWYMPRNDVSFMYENDYVTGRAATLTANTRVSMPMLFEAGDKYALVMEADRHGNYVGATLSAMTGGELRTVFDPAQTAPVQTEAPFTSPWRTLVIGSAEDIMLNTMLENLNPAPDDSYDFESWVAPGLSSWSWVSYYGGQEDPNIHKYFIDLAADMGWEYYILDEKWQPGSRTPGSRYEGMHPWFEEVRDYANAKGVKLWAWVDKQDVDTAAEREARFKEWSEAGIVGIKVDFFYNESQAILKLHDDIYKDAAKYKLMVNVHGSNPSSGEIRTYPNVITREAIKGQEQGGITVQQYTLIPFLRAAVGSADVTEQLYSRDTSKTTMGFQIALSTLIENGLHSMGSKPDEYYSIPAAVSYYTNFPTKWDAMAVIDAVVGDKVNLARKSGDVWYAAGISVKAGSFTYKPDFLDSGKTYTAVIFKEVAGERQNITMELMQNVTSTTDIAVAVQQGGGYAIKFIPKGGSDLTGITLKPTTLELKAFTTADITLGFTPADSKSTDVVWTVGDGTVLSFTAKSTGVTVKGLKEGTTTLTATSIYDDSIKAVLTVKVTPADFSLAEGWEILNDNNKFLITGEDRVIITTENAPKNQVIENNAFAYRAPAGDYVITAKISGGLNANYQGGFIGVFNKALTQFIAMGRRYHTMFPKNGSYNLVSCMTQGSENYWADSNKDGALYVMIEKVGNTFTTYYKTRQGDEWKKAQTVTNASLGTGEVYIGFFASSGGTTNAVDIAISDFTLNGEALKVAVKAPGATEAPDGEYEADEEGSGEPEEEEKPKDPNCYEAEDGVLSGGATLNDGIDASGGRFVGFLGNGNAVTITVNVAEAGDRTVKIHYIGQDTRGLQVSVNGGEAITLSATGNGSDWNSGVQILTVTLTLNAGENTVTLGNAGDWAPNVDCIVLGELA